MANWIKMQVSLTGSPKVRIIALATRLDRDAVVGKMLRLWAWGQTHTVTGRIDGVSEKDIDEVVGRKGFARALARKDVDWLVIGDGFIGFPRWDKHNGAGEKARAGNALRQERHRGKSNGGALRGGAAADTKGVTRIEERRGEEKATPAAPPLPAADEAAEHAAAETAEQAPRGPVFAPPRLADGGVFASLSDRNRVVAAWNLWPSMRAAGASDARMLQAAVDEITGGGWADEEARRDPVSWLIDRINQYCGSEEASRFPVSLKQFLRDKFTQPVVAWNFKPPAPHAPDPAEAVLDRVRRVMGTGTGTPGVEGSP